MKVPWDRGGLRTYLILLVLLVGRTDHRAILWGLPLLLLGAALQVYAKGCLRQNQVVAIGGPYRFVRHPFYTANLMIDLGLALMSGQWWVAALLLVWWLAVYYPVMRQEERILSDLFPDTYPAYQARLPRLLPFRRPLPSEGEGFSFSNPNLVSHTVFPRLLRALALPLLIYMVQEVRSHTVPARSTDLLVVAGFLSLSILAWELKLHLVEARPLLREAWRWPGVRLLVAAGLLCAAGLVHGAETESAYAVTAAAGVVLLGSLLLYAREEPWRLFAEGMVLAAAVVLCELPWLACLAIVWYAALALDQRLAGHAFTAAPPAAARAGWRLLANSYALVLTVGLLVAVTKELWAR